jgi:hypothetical protein
MEGLGTSVEANSGPQPRDPSRCVGRFVVVHAAAREFDSGLVSTPFANSGVKFLRHSILRHSRPSHPLPPRGHATSRAHTTPPEHLATGPLVGGGRGAWQRLESKFRCENRKCLGPTPSPGPFQMCRARFVLHVTALELDSDDFSGHFWMSGFCRDTFGCSDFCELRNQVSEVLNPPP